MATDANIKIPDDLLAQAQRLAQAEGKTADELAAEAVKREVARRLLAQIRLETAANRAGMTD